ncbi:MAG: YnbE family lipoprotein [Sphingomonadaceae bacterium]|nr:YnbE family lipoprotein [Sphingomonadaceae bacterium]
MVLGSGALALAGCIQVKAPEKPIEINLNVNVKQEVIVRLQKDASDFISNNPELFPK